MRLTLATVLLGTALGVGVLGDADANEASPSDAGVPGRDDGVRTKARRWCAEELIALSEGVCAVVPANLREPRTIVLFLHGVIKPDTDWQWAQQRALVRSAAAHGFVGLMPRGRRGHGPKGMEDWWTWPTSAVAQQALEDELLTEWAMAERALEGALGEHFAKRYVFGFSNGAYYASSLALRGTLPVGGYGIFAGGSGATYLVQRGKTVKRRPPIYVGYGHRDGDAQRDAKQFGKALQSMGWPSRTAGHAGVGHTMTDAMVAEALDLFE